MLNLLLPSIPLIPPGSQRLACRGPLPSRRKEYSFRFVLLIPDQNSLSARYLLLATRRPSSLLLFVFKYQIQAKPASSRHWQSLRHESQGPTPPIGLFRKLVVPRLFRDTTCRGGITCACAAGAGKPPPAVSGMSRRSAIPFLWCLKYLRNLRNFRHIIYSTAQLVD
jgi:hypothetical protein